MRWCSVRVACTEGSGRAHTGLLQGSLHSWCCSDALQQLPFNLGLCIPLPSGPIHLCGYVYVACGVVSCSKGINDHPRHFPTSTCHPAALGTAFSVSRPPPGMPIPHSHQECRGRAATVWSGMGRACSQSALVPPVSAWHSCIPQQAGRAHACKISSVVCGLIGERGCMVAHGAAGTAPRRAVTECFHGYNNLECTILITNDSEQEAPSQRAPPAYVAPLQPET